MSGQTSRTILNTRSTLMESSKAMQIEFEELQVPIDLETSVVVGCKDRAVGVFRADMIVEKCVLVERYLRTSDKKKSP